MTQGIRHNQGKPQWSLIPMKALEPGVRVLMKGAERYGTNNWRKGLLTREICESLLRHVYAYLEGEDNDSESGQPHVGHIIANAIFLSDMHQTRPDMDNRFSKEKTCCGKWDEYGKCTCVDNRREKVFESSALREAKREVVYNSYHLKGDGAIQEKEELKGGVLDESNSRQIAEDFADRWKNYREEYPKIVAPMPKYPSKDTVSRVNGVYAQAYHDQNSNIGRSYPKGLPWIDINEEEPEVGTPIEYRHGDKYRGTMIFSWGDIETCAMTHWRQAI